MELSRKFSKRRLFKSTIVYFLTCCMFFNTSLSVALAGPEGAQVVNGQVSFQQSSYNTTITASDKSIINYSSFDIARPEIVQFIQPGSSASVLNRILSANPTNINGTLLANGRVFFVNPAGVYIGAGARINVNQLVASGLNITNSDFINGQYNFAGGDGAVINSGDISAEKVYLIGRQVANSGSISCPAGYVVMASGDRVFLGEPGTDVVLEVDAPSLPESAGTIEGSGVLNEGTVDAAGGTIVLAAGDIYSQAISNTGSLSASFEAGEAGQVTLIANGGQVTNTGTIEASGSKGGQVAMEGARVGQFGTIHADGTDSDGGSVDLQASEVVALSSDSLTTANAGTNGNGGEIIIWADGVTRFYGNIEARGGTESGDGGFAEVSGQNLLYAGHSDLSAPQGEVGTLLLDPGTVTIADTGAEDTELDDGQILSTDGLASDDWTISDEKVESELDSADVTIQAITSITVDHPVDASSNTNAYDLTLGAPTINLKDPITLKSGANLLGEVGNATTNVSDNGLINNAIDLTASYGTVNVAAGTYTEDLTITTDGLELAGASDADPTQTVIQGVDKQFTPVFPDATNSTNVDIQANEVEIHGFKFLSPLADASIQEYSSEIVLKGTDIEIHHNIFETQQDATSGSGTFNGDTSVAIQTYSGEVLGHQPVDISGLYIHHNEFQGTPANGYYGVYINPQDQAIVTSNPVRIENNEFTGTIWRAITTERSYTNILNNTITTSTSNSAGSNSGIRVVNWAGDNVNHVTIQDNEVAGAASGQGFGFGIGLGTGYGDSLTDVIVTENEVSGDHVLGVQVNSTLSNVTIEKNSLTGGTTTVDLQNTTAAAVDASGNWWGSSEEATIQSRISNTGGGSVEYSPWLGNAGSSTTDPFDYTPDLSSIYTSTSIQDAIDLGVTDSTINVLAGTYTEDLTITTDGLELAGASDADPTQTVIQGVDKQFTPVFPDATNSTNVDIQADEIKIHGFKFLSPLADASIQEYSSGIVLKGTDIEIHHNIFETQQDATSGSGIFNGDTSVAIQTYSGEVSGHWPVDISGLYIHDNKFQGTPANGYYGVYINPQEQTIVTSNPVRIENNEFTGTIWRAITTERSYTNILNNTITTSTSNSAGSNSGIRVVNWAGDNVNHVTIQDNEVAGAASGQGFGFGIGLGTGYGDSLTDVIVTENEVSGDHVLGVQVNSTLSNVTIEKNSLTGGTTTVDLQNTTAAAVDASGNWWGSSEEATIQSRISNTGGGSVEYSPWLGNAGSSTTDPFDYTPDLSSIYTSTSIQDAIDLAASGATINVIAGTYNETVNVDRPLAGLYFTNTSTIGDTITLNEGLNIYTKSDGGITLNEIEDAGTHSLLVDTASLNTNDGQIDLDGSVEADAGITITGGIVNVGDGTSDKVNSDGAVSIAGTGAVTVNAEIDPTTVSITSNDDVAINNTVTADNLITVTAGIDGSGSVNLNSGGSLSLDKTNSSTSIGVTAADAITMTDGTVIDADTGTITLLADDNIAISRLVTTNNTASAVSITSTSGAVTDAGSNGGEDIEATSANAVVTIDAVTGVGSGNAIETEVTAVDIDNTSGNIEIDETDGVDIVLANAGTGNVNITADGTVTDSGAITADTLTINTSGGAGGAITLDLDTTHDADTINLTSKSGENIVFKDKDGVDIELANAGAGDVSITAAGSVTDSGAITAGKLTVDSSTAAAGGAITLDFGHDADTINLTSKSGENIDYTDTDEVDIELANAGTGEVSITAVGSVTDSGAITASKLTVDSSTAAVGGAITLDFGHDADTINLTSKSGENIDYTDTDEVDIELANAGAGDVSITAAGSVTDSGAITASKLTVDSSTAAAGGEIMLDFGHDADTINLTSKSGENIDYTDTDEVDIELANAGAGDVSITAAGSVTDSGAITASKLTVDSSTAAAGGEITLDFGHDADTINLTSKSGENIDYTDTDEIDIELANAGAGDVSITAAGSVTDSGAITASKLTVDSSTAAAGGEITLDFGHDSDTIDLTSKSGENIVYTDTDGVDIELANAGGGNVSVTAGGDVTDSGAITASTLTVKTLNDAGAAINLNTPGNDADTIDLRARNAADSDDAAGAITFIDADSVDIAKISTKSTATVTTGGSISVSGSISAGGSTTTLTADDDIKINANITDTTAISAHSGTDGSGNITFGAAGVTLDAPVVTLRAGDGLGGSGTTAQVDITTNNPTVVANSALTVRQDGAIADTPNVGNNGTIDLTLQSDDSSVNSTNADTWQSITADADSGITLQGIGNITTNALTSTNGNIDIKSKTAVALNGTVTTQKGGGVTVTAQGDVTTQQPITTEDLSQTTNSNIEIRSYSGDLNINDNLTAKGGGVKLVADDGNIYLSGASLNIIGTSDGTTGVTLPAGIGKAAIVIWSKLKDLNLGSNATLTANGSYDDSLATGVDDRKGVYFLPPPPPTAEAGEPIDVAIYLGSFNHLSQPNDKGGNVTVDSTVSMADNSTMVIDAHDIVNAFGSNFTGSVPWSNITNRLEVASRTSPTLDYAVENNTLPHADEARSDMAPSWFGGKTYILRGDHILAKVLAKIEPVPLVLPKPLEPEDQGQVEIKRRDAAVLGLGDKPELARAYPPSLNTDLNLDKAAQILFVLMPILRDSSGIAILNNIVVEIWQDVDQPITPEQEAMIAQRMSGTPAEEWVAALTEYVDVMSTMVGRPKTESVLWVMQTYVIPQAEEGLLQDQTVAFLEAQID